MTDTPALLPPHPDRPGRYWMTRTGWNIGKRVEIWEWSPAEPLWRHEQWGPMSPDLAGKAGYTLSVRHRILELGELAAVWEALAIMEKEAERLTTAMRNDFDSGVQSGMESAAAMLRAALENDA